MGDYGIKISKPGYDVLTATNVQLAFSSAFNSVKVFMQGATTGQTNEISIYHGLGYIPGFLVFGEARSDEMWAQGFIIIGNIIAAGNPAEEYFQTKADANYLYIDPNFTSERDFYYYIFLDESI